MYDGAKFGSCVRFKRLWALIVNIQAN